MMRAVKRLRAGIADREREWTEALVTDTISDVGLGQIRYTQGIIAGLRDAGERIDEMLKRYDEDEDGNDSEPRG